jgi:hypothetical protein
MLKPLLIVCTVLAAGPGVGQAQAGVSVEPAHLQSPRPLEEQTQAAAIRAYLLAWQTMDNAFNRNDDSVLDRDFVGTARDQLAQAIQQEASLGLHARYRDRSHDIQVVFYSPEGLSIQITDNAEYDVQVLDHDKILTAQNVRSRFVVVLTPAEVRWRVRVLQAQLQ